VNDEALVALETCHSRGQSANLHTALQATRTQPWAHGASGPNPQKGL